METSYLKTMSNDQEDELPPIKPIYLTKLKLASPRSYGSFAESSIKEKNHIKIEFSAEKEKPFTAYNCESMVEIINDNNTSIIANINEKLLVDSHFNIVKSQVVDKFTERSFNFSNDFSSSPKIDEFHTKQLGVEDIYENCDRIKKSKKETMKRSNINYTCYNFAAFNDPKVIPIFEITKLNCFEPEEVVDAIFSNESLRKINFTIFKIKLEVSDFVMRKILKFFVFRAFIVCMQFKGYHYPYSLNYSKFAIW